MLHNRPSALKRTFLWGFLILIALLGAAPATATEFANLPEFKYSYDPVSDTSMQISPSSPTITVSQPFDFEISAANDSGSSVSQGSTPGSFVYDMGFSNGYSHFNSGYYASAPLISPVIPYQDEEFMFAWQTSLFNLQSILNEMDQAANSKNYYNLLSSAMNLKNVAELQHNSLGNDRVSPRWENVQLNYLHGLEDFEFAADDMIAGIQEHFNGNETLSENRIQNAISKIRSATAHLDIMRSQIPQVVIVTPFPYTFKPI